MRHGNKNAANAVTNTKLLIQSVLIKQYRREGEKIKSLYSTSKRFPEALTGSRQAGAVFWGSKQALEKIAVSK